MLRAAAYADRVMANANSADITVIDIIFTNRHMTAARSHDLVLLMIFAANVVSLFDNAPRAQSESSDSRSVRQSSRHAAIGLIYAELCRCRCNSLRQQHRRCRAWH